MLFRQLIHAETNTYTYLVADQGSRQAVYIDPVRDEMSRLLQLLVELDLTLVAALDTHVHADHVTALGALRDATGCETIVGTGSTATCASRFVANGEQFRVGSLVFTALATPGHTDDSFCYLLAGAEGEPLRLFSGDTLLIRGCGRTDFQNGDPRMQYRSLQRLLALPDDTLVLPGHDYKGWTLSTIGEERRHNPRLQVAGEEAFVTLMTGLNLPPPRYMDVAVPANRQCGRTTPLQAG